MFFLKNNKKGISEVISFILLTLIIVVTSSVAYYFSQSLLDDNLQVRDEENMKLYLKKLSLKTEEITAFDGVSTSLPIDFSTGQLVFRSGQVYYQSEIKFDLENDICYSNVCDSSFQGFSRPYFNLTNYTFSSNLTLEPGKYYIILSHIKNESEINVKIR